MELLNLLRAGEGPHLEFKREFTPQAHDMAKAMAALANTGGGILLLGIDDKGVPIGLSEPVRAMERLAGIARTLSPPLSPEIDKIHVGEATAIVYAKIPSCAPCLYSGKMFVRVGATSVEATGEDLRALSQRDWRPKAAPVTLPQALFSPPPVRGFRGRDRELERLRSLLRSDGPVVVVIEGIGGVGKTALAAQFANSIGADGQASFWLDCRVDSSFESIAAALAAFARRQGNLSLGEILETGELPFEERVAQASAALADQRWILFFDEYHSITDPLVNRFFKHVAEHARLVKLFLICRRRPSLTTVISPRLLVEETLRVGLDLGATSQFLSDCGLECPSNIAEEIWKLTGEGHPKAIEVFVARARRYPLSELLLSLPVFREEFTREWLAPLLDELPEAQRQLALDLSVFDRPVAMAAIASMFPDTSAEELIAGLVDGFILDHVVAASLRMHPLIREFCQALIPDPRAKHRWAANHYASSVTSTTHADGLSDGDVEALTAAWSHFVHAGDPVGAMSMLDRLRPSLMNRGHYQQVIFLIEHTPATPEKLPWYEIDKARILALWGEREPAEATLKSLLTSSSPEVAREAVLVLAANYNDRGFPKQAKKLLTEHRSRCTVNVPPTVRRRFLHRLVQAHLLLGDTEQAVTWASRLVESCEAEGDELGGAISLRQMALVLRAQKKIEVAASLGQLSCTLLLKNGRLREAAISQRVLAGILAEQGNPEKAVDNLEQALHIFLEMGDKRNGQLCRAALEDLKEGRVVAEQSSALLEV